MNPLSKTETLINQKDNSFNLRKGINQAVDFIGPVAMLYYAPHDLIPIIGKGVINHLREALIYGSSAYEKQKNYTKKALNEASTESIALKIFGLAFASYTHSNPITYYTNAPNKSYLEDATKFINESGKFLFIRPIEKIQKYRQLLLNKQKELNIDLGTLHCIFQGKCLLYDSAPFRKGLTNFAPGACLTVNTIFANKISENLYEGCKAAFNGFSNFFEKKCVKVLNHSTPSEIKQKENTNLSKKNWKNDLQRAALLALQIGGTAMSYYLSPKDFLSGMGTAAILNVTSSILFKRNIKNPAHKTLFLSTHQIEWKKFNDPRASKTGLLFANFLGMGIPLVFGKAVNFVAQILPNYLVVKKIQFYCEPNRALGFFGGMDAMYSGYCYADQLIDQAVEKLPVSLQSKAKLSLDIGKSSLALAIILESMFRIIYTAKTGVYSVLL